ncbi:penicillin-binding protein 2 [Streptomyces sp. TRM 70351]|uniref:peptidoglycan D,D-transpeptidase FtsI family protein n=1 Tax=Streptomyces sp. TRM 70351 TaxID=3116552 RepID=UPI002E7B6A9A|nr:penicillin-binding protein 2 [Streptomyces sp. TRM 70351]MEE1928755.1 penicillin-binding protein 2 [Streptomyces sp. TRM 70351]
MSAEEPPRRRVPRPARPARGGGPARSGREGKPGAREPAARKPEGRKRAERKPAARKPAARRPARPAAARELRLARPRARLRLLSVAVTLVLTAFTLRLLQVQAVDADSYAEAANVNRYVTVPIAAERGAVTDRRGRDLATTVDAYDITADPFLFKAEQALVPDAPARAAALLAPILGQDPAELEAKLTDPPSERYVLLARQQPPQAWRQIQDLRAALADKADKAQGKAPNVLAGVYAEPRSKRLYPNKELAARVLGFVNAEGEGGGGLEAQYEQELAGEDGKITYAQSAGRRVPTAGGQEQPATPGTGIELTLDRDIQWAAQQAITDQVEESAADGGYVIVQDTRTGEVLAMANAPGYDPNDLSTVTTGTLGNPALQDVYEPGSTAKLMTMAAVLEEGVATPTTRVTVPNRLPRAGRNFADDHNHETYHLTLAGVLAKSSNIGTILAAERLGKTQKQANKVLHGYLTDFGLGRPTGLGFPGESPGILAQPEDWSPTQQHTITFGQGVSVNALQAASVYSTIANGGVRITPSLVRGTTGPDGRYEPAPEPGRNRVVSAKTAADLTRMLEEVVTDEEGTGRTAAIPGYRVTGKTGTSNRVDPETGRYSGYTASFAGFAPADDPRVTVYCAVQNPTKGGYHGSTVCGPVFQHVMQFALKTLQAAPTGGKAPDLPTTFEPGD